MKVGIIGLPESGKTTLFNALTRSSADTRAFGGHRDEVHLGSVPVPDERFDVAVQVCKPKKVTPAALEITDGGARVEVTDKREKFGTDFFVGVRNMDALVVVLRAFTSSALPDPPDGIDPKRDAEMLLEELLLADLGVVEARLERLEKAKLQKRQTASEAVEHATLLRIHKHLEGLQPVRTLDLSADEERSIRSYAFVSGKQLIFVANIGEADLGAEPAVTAGLRAFAAENGIPVVELCAKVEMECAQMEPSEERDFLEAMGISEPARDRLTRAAYAALGYISFFTVGPDEVRAWTIRVGTNALGAAEKIHTDIARTFIRAEVIAFEDFRAAGGCDEAKAAGKMRLEGKEYIVRDGEIVHIRNSKG